MGKLHPLIVHLPIGILLLNALLVGLSKRPKYAYLSATIRLILLLGAISSAAACLTGWLLSQNSGYTEGVLFYHQWLGIGVAIASFALYFSKKYDNLWAWLVLSLGISITGHFGGTLTHGENYLFSTENAQVVARDEATEGASLAKKLPADIQEAVVFKDLIQPILKEKCWTCHNNVKQKGQLNLEDRTAFLKGGKNGAVVLANQSANSELIKRILLDINDEHHMAPKGKPQPTEQEITLLKWWIDQGVDFDRKVKELEQTDAVKAVFASLNASKSVVSKNDNTLFIPTAAVAKADAQQIDRVRKTGILLMPVAPNSNYLQANFVSILKAGNDALKALLPFKEQLIWLKLSGTKITDSACATIAEFRNLTRLSLDNTHITNAGMRHLSALSNLHYLNLVGTDITTDGLGPLSNLSKLQHIFLFKTTILPDKLKEWQQKMPQTTFDTGGYLVPSWPSDTAVFKKNK